MVALSLFPGGVLQRWGVVQQLHSHARSFGYIGRRRAHLVDWLRLPGDLVLILFGAVPWVIASIKGYLVVRAADWRKCEYRYTDDSDRTGQQR